MRVAMLLVALLAIEGCLQTVTRLPREFALVRSLKRLTDPRHPEQDSFWKKRFLEAFGPTSGGEEHPSTKYYRPDPVLGWTPRGNLGPMSTNSTGFRSPWEYVVDFDSYVVLVVGDSYTFGDGAEDGDVWPTILQELDGNLQVLNFGVSGYGIDQMYLMLQRQIESFRPDFVIAAFIDDDLKRSLLSFRAYLKPRFEIDDGELRLTNLPLETSTAKVARAIKREILSKELLSEVRSYGLLVNAFRWARPREDDEAELESLNTRLLEEMTATSRAYGADFLLLYLPHGEEITDPSYRSYGQELFERFVASHNVDSLNPRPAFFEHPDVQFSLGHYRRNGAELVATLVHRKIVESSAYRHKTESASGRRSLSSEP